MSPQISQARHELLCGKYSLQLGKKTHVVGILNLTPDSFSDGGVYFKDIGKALARIEEMAQDGAHIVDIGGESTRPGSRGISADEELDRVIPVIKEASKRIDIPISIDTSKSEVAEAAIISGASLINDVTGLRSDPRMARVAAESGAGVIIMHMKGEPRTMQENPTYCDLMREILSSLRESIDIAADAGVAHDRIVVDPGIGFGKTVEHNLAILNRLSELKVLDKPIMVGVSRKSFIGSVLNKPASARLMGTVSACAIAIANGASLVRVHDTRELVDAAKIADAIKGEGDRLS